jgi:hypothetical protein
MRTILAVVVAGLGACGGGDATDYMAHPEECGTPLSEPVAAGDFDIEWQCIEGNCDSPAANELTPKSELVVRADRMLHNPDGFAGLYFYDVGASIVARREAECLSLRTYAGTGDYPSREIGRLCTTSLGAFGHYSTPDSSWLLCAKR